MRIQNCLDHKPYLKLVRIAVWHFGHLIICMLFDWPFFISLSCVSIYSSIPFLSKTWPQSASCTNRAPSSSSLPKKISVNSSLSQIRHLFGHGSPHRPAHRWPHFFKFFVQGLLQRRLLHISPHDLVHWKWSHFHWQGSLHSLHSSPHVFWHLLCEHLFWHFSRHGGQFLVQNTLHLWPQNRVRSHFDEQGWWSRPRLHPLHVPENKQRKYDWSSVIERAIKFYSYAVTEGVYHANKLQKVSTTLFTPVSTWSIFSRVHVWKIWDGGHVM